MKSMARNIFSDFSVRSRERERKLTGLQVSLPGLIAHTNMDQQSVQTLKEHIEGILK